MGKQLPPNRKILTIWMQMWLPYYAASLPHCHICIVATDIVFTYCIATWLYKIQSGKHANSMCTLVPSSATDCGNYQSLETVTNNSEKKTSLTNEKECLRLLLCKFSKKSVCLVQERVCGNYLIHSVNFSCPPCVWAWTHLWQLWQSVSENMLPQKRTHLWQLPHLFM